MKISIPIVTLHRCLSFVFINKWGKENERKRKEDCGFSLPITTEPVVPFFCGSFGANVFGDAMLIPSTFPGWVRTVSRRRCWCTAEKGWLHNNVYKGEILWITFKEKLRMTQMTSNANSCSEESCLFFIIMDFSSLSSHYPNIKFNDVTNAIRPYPHPWLPSAVAPEASRRRRRPLSVRMAARSRRWAPQWMSARRWASLRSLWRERVMIREMLERGIEVFFFIKFGTGIVSACIQNEIGRNEAVC